jgi:hypothetical protein
MEPSALPSTGLASLAGAPPSIVAFELHDTVATKPNKQQRSRRMRALSHRSARVRHPQRASSTNNNTDDANFVERREAVFKAR